MVVTLPTLMPHQEQMRDFIVTHPFCGVWLDIGGAKTLTTLSALAQIRPSGHILVIAPKAIARNTWADEIKKWGLGVRTVSLVVDNNDKPISRKKRLELYSEFFTSPPTMYFINQDLVKDLVSYMPKKGGVIQWPFPTVIIDEAQEFKNPRSVKFKQLAKVRPAMTRMIQLTGTPAPQSLLDIWSQVYLLDQGFALGHKYTDFRNRFFDTKTIVNGYAVDWKLKSGAEVEIHQRIQHLVLSSTNKSIPIPKVTHEHIKVALPEYAQNAYRDFQREKVLELATPDPKDPTTLTVTADHAAVLRMKLLQFASGTIYNGDNHDKDFSVIHTEKLKALGNIALEAQRDDLGPLLVAFRFRADKEIIPVHLKSLGIHCEVFDGSAAMKQRWNNREIPVMLLQPASFQHGLNLQQGGNQLIWYSLPDSSSQYDQTIGRLRRIGQSQDVVVRSLITEKTVDETIPKLLDGKRVTQKRLLEAVNRDVQAILRDAAMKV